MRRKHCSGSGIRESSKLFFRSRLENRFSTGSDCDAAPLDIRAPVCQRVCFAFASACPFYSCSVIAPIHACHILCHAFLLLAASLYWTSAVSHSSSHYDPLFCLLRYGPHHDRKFRAALPPFISHGMEIDGIKETFDVSAPR